MPGQPVALARVFWNPPAIHPRELPAAAGSATIIRQAQETHVSLNPLSASLLRLATEKACALVQKLWTMLLPCGMRRKTKI